MRVLCLDYANSYLATYTNFSTLEAIETGAVNKLLLIFLAKSRGKDLSILFVSHQHEGMLLLPTRKPVSLSGNQYFPWEILQIIYLTT